MCKNRVMALFQHRPEGTEGNYENSQSRHMTFGPKFERTVLTNRTFFDSVLQFRYLGTTATCQNCICEEVKSGLISMNVVQHHLSSGKLSKSVKIKIYKAVIVRVVLHDSECLPQNPPFRKLVGLS